MPVVLPDLAGWSFEDLTQEMIAAIPKYNPEWTNFNPSDPGVTILEMLAWIAQTLIYRADRIPEESYRKFFELAAGSASFTDSQDPAYQKLAAFREQLSRRSSPDWEMVKGETRRFLNSRYRAITREDFRNLAMEASSRIQRVEVQITAADEVELILAAKGVSPNPSDPNGAAEGASLIQKARDYLKPRLLLGTPLRVRLAVYTPLRLKVTLIGQSGAVLQSDLLKRLVEERIRLYLDNFQGGPEGKGWPYGRDLTVFDLFYVLEKTAGVKHVREVTRWDGERGGWRPFQELKIDGLIDLEGLEILIEKDEG